MSKVIIKDEKQLLKFLSVLAEEVVQQAYADVGGKSQQQQVAQDIKASKRQFIEEEDPPASEEPPAPKASPPPAATKPEDKMSIAPKFDSLIDAINDLRGAPSLRDNTVETQLRAYYDKLGEAEAASAILFFRTMSQVMKGEIDGASAPDPGSYQIITKMEGGEGTPAEPPKTAAPSTPVGDEAPVSEPTEEEPEQEPSEGEEDTAPPIKVGSTPVTEAYRQKIRQLLGRG